MIRPWNMASGGIHEDLSPTTWRLYTNDIPFYHINYMKYNNISCLSDWTICGFDSDRKPCLYPITWPCLSPITWSTELGSQRYIPLVSLPAIYVNSISCVFWLHDGRKSFLSSFSSVTSSWMRTYTGCDDVTRWRQAAFAYAENVKWCAERKNFRLI